MAIKEGSIRYYADKLNISIGKASNLGYKECQRLLEEKENIRNVLEDSEKKENGYNAGSDTEIMELSQSILDKIHDKKELEDIINQAKDRIFLASVIYCEKYVLGQLKGSLKDSSRANFCLKVLNSFSQYHKKKSPKKLDFLSKLEKIENEKSKEIKSD